MRHILVFSFLILALTGCRSVWDPTFMPSGYTWHNDVYKAPPGPEAQSLGYDYSAARNEGQVEMWQGIARGLIDSLEAQSGLSAQQIYIEKPAAVNAFNSSLDYALREELRARGYTLASAPGGASLQAQAFAPKDEKLHISQPFNGDVPQERKPWNPEKESEFVFVLTLLQDGKPVNEVRSTQQMPAYGYIAGEGNVAPWPGTNNNEQAPAVKGALNE